MFVKGGRRPCGRPTTCQDVFRCESGVFSPCGRHLVCGVLLWVNKGRDVSAQNTEGKRA